MSQRKECMETTKIVRLYFSGKLGQWELQCLRGAVNKMLHDAGGSYEGNMLFHNHEAGGLRYGYPLVQFRRAGSQAVIVGIGDAADAVHSLAEKHELKLTIGRRETVLTVEKCEETFYTPTVADEPKLYSLTKYIALTDQNLKDYGDLLALSDKIIFLEKIIVGNILSFFKGIGHHTDERLVAVLTAVDRVGETSYKGVKWKTFCLHFVSNVVLPDGIGLGKSAAVGYGTLMREKLDDKFIKRFTNG